MTMRTLIFALLLSCSKYCVTNGFTFVSQQPKAKSIIEKHNNNYRQPKPIINLLRSEPVVTPSICHHKPTFVFSSEASTTSSLLASVSSSDTTETAADANNEDDDDVTIGDSTRPTRCVNGVASRTGPLNQAVAEVANISLEDANDLIEIGAVWAKMQTLSEDDLLSLYDDDSSAEANARTMYADVDKSFDEDEADVDRYIEQMEQIRFRRILTPSFVEAGTDLRIYPQPRRFTEACCEMKENKARLLYEDTTFIVVDKPPMLPTQPDTSNYFECCPGCASEHYGPFYDIIDQEVERPLLCHRVDTVVGGCVVMAKDRNGQKVFQEYQRDRKLRKVYLAVTSNPVPLGLHLHWMWAPQTMRGKSGGPPCQLISHATPESRRKARQFWIRCTLQVTQSVPIEIDGKTYYQNTIRLVTGRKHQIRAQLASLGCPILNDSLYEPMSGLTLDKLEAGEIEDDMDIALSKCRVPAQPIGLQAHAILFGGIAVKANPPWWQQQEEASS